MRESLADPRDDVARIRNIRGFTIVEIVIAMFVLAVFLLPLMQHFISARRVSLAARDTVIVNSFQTACVGELRRIEYNDLASGKGATLSEILKRYSGGKTVGNLDIQTSVEINRCVRARMLTIDVSSEFRFPGTNETQGKRKIGLRGFAFPKP